MGQQLAQTIQEINDALHVTVGEAEVRHTSLSDQVVIRIPTDQAEKFLAMLTGSDEYADDVRFVH